MSLRGNLQLPHHKKRLVERDQHRNNGQDEIKYPNQFRKRNYSNCHYIKTEEIQNGI